MRISSVHETIRSRQPRRMAAILPDRSEKGKLLRAGGRLPTSDERWTFLGG
jgi:hypothetical protein